ncbi:unnamed protein product [Sympodiomycopsis kandeliae]
MSSSIGVADAKYPTPAQRLAIAATTKTCGNRPKPYYFFDATTGEDLDRSGDGVILEQHQNKVRALTDVEEEENRKYARMSIALRNSKHQYAKVETPSVQRTIKDRQD